MKYELRKQLEQATTDIAEIHCRLGAIERLIEAINEGALMAGEASARKSKADKDRDGEIKMLQERVDGLSYHVEKLRNSSPKPSASSYNVGSLSTPDSISGSIILDGERYKAALEEILKRVDKGGQLARWDLRNIAERALGIKSDLEDGGK